ncbi:protoglobin domain-containing protein [Acidithiobacillus ferrooxidans]|nr:protoglobin domain-containing protein [Acidithiobacillus ferrooxidans]MCR2832105.1 protoglobin domain-containing protein [Acidithiobacillus ferrooxidans]
MSANPSDVQTFIHISGFSPEDEEHLRHLGQHLVPRLPELTDRFYGRLLADERTRPHVEGRVEQLKKTQSPGSRNSSPAITENRSWPASGASAKSMWPPA